jgi:acyl-CoA synthetase (AMP-forming)/AMP-acid ligase II
LAIVEDRWGQPRSDWGAEELSAGILPIGAIGEIIVTGDHVLKGYLGAIGDHETKFRISDQVWHRTGDAGCFDDRGRLWLHGRCAARIEDARGRLYPFGVECVAMTFPEVRRAAVAAHRAKRLLVVEADGNPELEQHLRAATAWAHIDDVVFLERLPVDRRHNAKVDYPALHELLNAQFRT